MPVDSNGKTFDLSAARYMQTYLTFHSQSLLLTGFQKGEKLNVAPTGDIVTVQQTFEGDGMFFISDDHTGNVNLTTVPSSHINNLFQYLLDFMNSADISDPSQDPTFMLKSINRLTGRVIHAENCLFSGQPQEQDNDGANTLAWKALSGNCFVTRPTPDEIALLQ
ncbi:hypothetical protein [Lactiplantibacillus daowaiensis]|uniref:Uncharacterized protein n=1 Tax=Lactiplantibacillus daowaiensis TaxID=2559918 RepID=A0ABW1RY05_9LACO|nr:hypothetical protein [Lactiplantibacillus daowaiensis]